MPYHIVKGFVVGGIKKVLVDVTLMYFLAS